MWQRRRFVVGHHDGGRNGSRRLVRTLRLTPRLPADTAAPADTEAPSDTEASTDTEAPADGEAFAVDTSACEDPDAATAPIEGTIKIGSSIPLSGGPAVLFAPFGAGAQAYIDYYNTENGGVNGQQLELTIKDDQYTADLTKANVDELIFDDQVSLLAGIIGSANNLAVQADTTAQCIPQLYAATGAPNWGDVENNPWTSGLLVPYAIEAEVVGSVRRRNLRRRRHRGDVHGEQRVRRCICRRVHQGR